MDEFPARSDFIGMPLAEAEAFTLTESGSTLGTR
jgi:hypothetical protein